MRNVAVWPVLILSLGAVSCRTAGGFEYRDFAQHPDLTLVGDASIRGDLVELTGSKESVVGGVWRATPVDVAAGFETEFQFRIFSPVSPYPHLDPGADGLAFVVQSQGPSVLGGGGGGMGYGDLEHALAVEFDTWDDTQISWGVSGQDPNGNHISIQCNGGDRLTGEHSQSLACATDIPDMSDGEAHTARITCAAGTLKVYLDGAAEPTVEAPVDLAAVVGNSGRAWVGLTAATGAIWQGHELKNWTFRPL